MKKINVLMLAVLVLFSGFFAGCKKDSTTGTGPDISFTNGIDNTSVTSGDSWTVTGLITSDVGLDQVKYFKTVGGSETQIGAAVTSFTDKNTFDFVVPVITNITATTTVRIEATDKDNITNSLIYTITVGATTATVSILSTSLGSATWNTTDGSFYSVGTQTVYKYNATGAAANVDFGYMYGDAGGSNLATIFSPEWASAQSLTQKITSPSNATKFVVTTLNAAEFDAIGETGNAAITSAVTSATAQYVNNLQVGGANAGKIIGFVLQNTKKGLIKFGTVTNGSNVTYPQGSGTATFTIKVIK